MFDLFFKLLLVQQVQLKCVPNMVGVGVVGGSLIHFRWAVKGGLDITLDNLHEWERHYVP